MNVSMQDGFNLGWKLGSVLTGRSPESLLATYSAERQPVAQQLIDFDKEWSTLMARKPEEITDPQDLATYYLATAEFPSGFMTQYGESMIVTDAAHQALAEGFPLGKRFKSAEVVRVCDGNVVHLGHHAKADGRWRIYAFADAPAAGEPSQLATWAEWLSSPESPIARFTPGRRRTSTPCSTSRRSTSSASRTSTSRGCPRSSCPRRAARPDRLGEGLRRRPQRVEQRRHLRGARAVARRRRRRGAPRPVRRGGAAADGDGRARGLLRAEHARAAHRRRRSLTLSWVAALAAGEAVVSACASRRAPSSRRRRRVALDRRVRRGGTTRRSS